jgi:hypothetical protein
MFMGQRLIVNQEEKQNIQKMYEQMTGVAFGGEMNGFKKPVETPTEEVKDIKSLNQDLILRNVDFYYDDVTKSFEVVSRNDRYFGQGGKVIRYTASIKK